MGAPNKEGEVFTSSSGKEKEEEKISSSENIQFLILFLQFYGKIALLLRCASKLKSPKGRK